MTDTLVTEWVVVYEFNGRTYSESFISQHVLNARYQQLVINGVRIVYVDVSTTPTPYPL